MRKLLTILVLPVIAVLIGCEKSSDPVTPTVPTTGTFTTESVKLGNTYFSFATQGKVDSTKDWDIKLTTLYAPDDTSKSFKYPGIVLNRAKNVQAKVLDSLAFESVDASTVTGLQADPSDDAQIIGIKCFFYTGPPSHKLNPYDNRTFVLQTAAGKRAKMRMLTYYNDAGASGFVKFEYSVK